MSLFKLSVTATVEVTLHGADDWHVKVLPLLFALLFYSGSEQPNAIYSLTSVELSSHSQSVLQLSVLFLHAWWKFCFKLIY
jgi:hypothetical protein